MLTQTSDLLFVQVSTALVVLDFDDGWSIGFTSNLDDMRWKVRLS